MSKFLNTLIIGAASGAAAAYFFTTEKGKACLLYTSEGGRLKPNIRRFQTALKT